MRLVPIGLFLLSVACPAAADDHHPPDVFPLGVADFDRGIAYVPNAVGGVDAVALKTGARRWRSRRVGDCGGLVDGHPLCWRIWGEGEETALQLFVLDRASGRARYRTAPLRTARHVPPEREADPFADPELRLQARSSDASVLVCRPRADDDSAVFTVDCHAQVNVQCRPASNFDCVSGPHALFLARLTFDPESGELTSLTWPAEPATPREFGPAEWKGLYIDERIKGPPGPGIRPRVLRAMRIRGDTARPVWSIPMSPMRVLSPRP